MLDQATLKAILIGCTSMTMAVPGSLWAQATVQGQVVNGTTNRAVSGAKVLLLQPRQGMQEVATTLTDARGHFVFPSEGIDPQSFYLVQANFQDVPYHAPVQFSPDGKAEINVTVYEATRQAQALRVRQARVLLRAAGNKVDVEELFAIQNPSAPERTFVDSSGTFHFRIQPGVGTPRVAVAGLMNMPLPQAAVAGKQPGEYSILYPLKPGLTVVMLGYQTDYSSAEFQYGDSVPYAIEHAEMDVLPATLAVASEIFKPAGSDSDSGGEKFLAEGLPSGAALAATLRGEAAPEPASGQPETSEEQVKVTPNPTTRLGMPLLASLLLLLVWALGVRLAKEWPRFKIADLDELFSQGKIAEKKYWKERLELKARLMALVKKSQALSPETYAARGPRP
ncbi:MAG: hypothetical protein DMG21_12830 [Acidobacteria bacterium]|nr:MAG: hypothetical protein DMG21_12830 [Acidobacteriota bacterium]